MTDGFKAHAWQTTAKGDPRYVHGRVTHPEQITERGTTCRVQACVIVGWCSAGRHDHCWQADGIPPPAHEYESCDEPHPLRCRCACHDTTPERPEEQPEQLTLI